MSDIFVSYAHEDRSRAEELAQRLEGRGWSIFWDRTIPIGKTWRETIGRELASARCVIVLWSKSSIESGWVQEEADDAKRRGVLLPVLIEKVQPPMGFRSIQAAELVDWDASEPPHAFHGLIAGIGALTGPLPDEQKTEKHDERPSAKPAPKVGGIFINYRREDSISAAGRLHDRLAQTFGTHTIFMDISDIPVGADIAEYIRKEVARRDVFLVIIGPKWLKDKRLHQPDDFVAIEIAAALFQDIRVIPVLVNGARMPKESELPFVLKALARIQAVEVRDTHFNPDACALIGSIRGAGL